jgi:hypothetical protein
MLKSIVGMVIGAVVAVLLMKDLSDDERKVVEEEVEQLVTGTVSELKARIERLEEKLEKVQQVSIKASENITGRAIESDAAPHDSLSSNNNGSLSTEKLSNDQSISNSGDVSVSRASEAVPGTQPFYPPFNDQHKADRFVRNLKEGAAIEAIVQTTESYTGRMQYQVVFIYNDEQDRMQKLIQVEDFTGIPMSDYR